MHTLPLNNIGIIVRPIFHWAGQSHVGAYEGIHFVVGMFQITFSQIQIFNC